MKMKLKNIKYNMLLLYFRVIAIPKILEHP